MTPTRTPKKAISKAKRPKKGLKNEPVSSSLLPVAVPPSSQNLPASVPAGDRDLLSIYLKEMLRYPLLSADEEKDLAKDFQENQSREAFQRLVQSNLRFVVKLAFEYARYGARVLDLIQEGNMGLLRAVRDFDPNRDVRLTTYAVWWIKSYIQDFLLRNWSLVKIGTTAAQKKLFYRLKKEQEKFEREGLRPELTAIAMNLGVEESDVKLMQERMQGRDISMDAPTRSSSNENGLEISNRIADPGPLPGEVFEDEEQKELFSKALAEFKITLDERENHILQERLLSENPKTLIEIGGEYGFTKERARQIEERVKLKLKNFLAEKYPDITVDLRNR